MSTLDQLLGRLAAALDNLLCVALEEDLAHGLGVGIVEWLGVGKVPWGVEGFGKREMLLGNDAPRDALSPSAHGLFTRALRSQVSYRSQHGVDELVRLLGPHQGPHLEHANGQPGYDGGVLSQRLFQHLAVVVVVV